MTSRSKRTVTITTVSEGVNFGTFGIVRCAKTGRRLASTNILPHGFVVPAREAAAKIAEAKGWTVVA